LQKYIVNKHNIVGLQNKITKLINNNKIFFFANNGVLLISIPSPPFSIKVYACVALGRALTNCVAFQDSDFGQPFFN
jgi:hypothetical protein